MEEGMERKGPKEESLEQFRGSLEGWVTSRDGEDFCPMHWKEYLDGFKKDERRWIKDDSSPTSALAETRKARDGWLVYCKRSEGGDCEEEVFIPY